MTIEVQNITNFPGRILWDFGYIALQEKKLSNNTKLPLCHFFQDKSNYFYVFLLGIKCPLVYVIGDLCSCLIVGYIAIIFSFLSSYR